MGFFKRKPVESLAVAPEPEIVERPTVQAYELERMVYETYLEKLSLEKESAEKDATISLLKEQVDKLNAAETFSRQSESERRRFESEAKRLKEDNDRLKEELRQEKAKVSTRDLKIIRINEGRDAWLADKLAEFLRDMLLDAEASTGNWSKARVVGFIDRAMSSAGLKCSEGGGK